MELIYTGSCVSDGFEWFTICVERGPIKFHVVTRRECGADEIKVVGDFTPSEVERLHLLAQATLMPDDASDDVLSVTIDGGGILMFSGWNM